MKQKQKQKNPNLLVLRLAGLKYLFWGGGGWGDEKELAKETEKM